MSSEQESNERLYIYEEGGIARASLKVTCPACKKADTLDKTKSEMAKIFSLQIPDQIEQILDRHVPHEDCKKLLISREDYSPEIFFEESDRDRYSSFAILVVQEKMQLVSLTVDDFGEIRVVSEPISENKTVAELKAYFGLADLKRLSELETTDEYLAESFVSALRLQILDQYAEISENLIVEQKIPQTKDLFSLANLTEIYEQFSSLVDLKSSRQKLS